MQQSCLGLALSSTPMTWWHDSAVPSKLEAGLNRGATGVTTNPMLSWEAIQRIRDCGQNGSTKRSGNNRHRGEG